jgi:hypothetical protein
MKITKIVYLFKKKCKEGSFGLGPREEKAGIHCFKKQQGF